jgi:hypothetical protein
LSTASRSAGGDAIAAPHSEKERRRDAVLAAACGFAFALVCASGIAGLGDTDPYRHMRYAIELWRSGLRLRGHPFLPFTLLGGGSGVDLWLGFHWLLLPFTPLGVLWGARLAGACIAAAVAAFLAWLLRRLGQVRPLAFALAPLAISPFFAFRDHLARPSHLTVPLVLLGLCAGAGEIGPGWALAAGFAHGLLHLSSPLTPFYTALGLLSARLAGGPGSARALLWAVGGLAIAFLVRPDRANYLGVAFLHNAGTLGLLPGGAAPGSGVEAAPLPFDALLSETWPGLVLLALAWTASRTGTPSGSRAMRAAAQVALAVSFVLTLRTGRFLDYVPPLFAVSAALLWPREGVRSRPLRLAAAGAALAGVALAARGVDIAWEVGGAVAEPPAAYEALAAEVRSRVPPGALLFTDDMFRTAVVYGSLPEYRYIAMADPSLLQAANPELFWLWHHAVTDGTLCERPRCDGALAGPGAVAEAIRRFGSEWIVMSGMQSALLRQLLSAPDSFELVSASGPPGHTLLLWHLRKGGG